VALGARSWSSGSSREPAGSSAFPRDSAVGLRWAQLLADLRRRGQPMSIKDSLIAATALAHDLALATLNQRDFKPARVKLVDPSAWPPRRQS